MGLYLYEFLYTSVAIAALVKNPKDRIDVAAKPLATALGSWGVRIWRHRRGPRRRNARRRFDGGSGNSRQRGRCAQSGKDHQVHGWRVVGKCAHKGAACLTVLQAGSLTEA